jgi:hypothetical protein
MPYQPPSALRRIIREWRMRDLRHTEHATVDML